MNKKLVIAFLMVVVLGCGCAKEPVSNSDSNETEKVKAENAVLKATILKLQADMEQINSQSKVLSAENGVLKTEIRELKASNEKVKTIQSFQTEAIPSTPPVQKEPVPNSNQIIKISKPIFGIYLGGNLSDLDKQFSLEPISAAKEDEDDPTKLWMIRPSDQNLSLIGIVSFNDYIASVILYFKDTSDANFDALKKQLTQTYGKEKELGLDGVVFGGKRIAFAANIDNTGIQISLDKKAGFGESDRLTVGYIHEPLQIKITNETERRKMAKVQGNL